MRLTVPRIVKPLTAAGVVVAGLVAAPAHGVTATSVASDGSAHVAAAQWAAAPGVPDHAPAVLAVPPVSSTAVYAALHPRWYPHWEPGVGKGTAASWPASWPRPHVVAPLHAGTLTGRTVVVDPGHNLGNSTHSYGINQHYWVGLTKICNTTGTATNSGYPEATYTYDVALRLAHLLARAGATVVLTRDRNDDASFGPCIQARGLLGGEVGADLEVSIHADGGPSYGRGAFVYTPAQMSGYTSTTKAQRSYQLASDVLNGLVGQGLKRSTYLVPNIAPDRQQGTLNVATVPIVIVETLNMRNHSDALIARSADGRQHVALGLFAGIERTLTRK